MLLLLPLFTLLLLLLLSLLLLLQWLGLEAAAGTPLSGDTEPVVALFAGWAAPAASSIRPPPPAVRQCLPLPTVGGGAGTSLHTKKHT